jgi:hypothetical protein
LPSAAGPAIRIAAHARARTAMFLSEAETIVIIIEERNLKMR